MRIHSCPFCRCVCCQPGCSLACVTNSSNRSFKQNQTVSISLEWQQGTSPEVPDSGGWVGPLSGQGESWNCCPQCRKGREEPRAADTQLLAGDNWWAGEGGWSRTRRRVECVPVWLSHVWLFVTLWTVAHQVPLSMESRRAGHSRNWGRSSFPVKLWQAVRELKKLWSWYWAWGIGKDIVGGGTWRGGDMRMEQSLVSSWPQSLQPLSQSLCSGEGKWPGKQQLQDSEGFKCPENRCFVYFVHSFWLFWAWRQIWFLFLF